MYTNQTSSIFRRREFYALLLLFCLGLNLPLSAQSTNRVLNLSSNADITVMGRTAREAVNATAPGALAGDLKLLAADLNNDTVDDLIIGVPFADGPSGTPRVNSGAVYVVLSRGGTASGTVRDLLDNPPDVIIHGARAGDRLGTSLAAGDVNGDGTKDLLVGAPFADETNRPDVGNVYALFGGSRLMQTAIRDMSSASQPAGPDVKIIGWGGPANKQGIQDDADNAGAAIAAGDINRDGVDDILVGAPGQDGIRDDTERNSGGAIYGFFGQRNWAPGTIRDAGQSTPATGGVNFLLYGKASTRSIPGLGSFSFGGSLGTAVAVGDVNGDGTADVITSAPTLIDLSKPDESGIGEVYGVFGSSQFSTTAATVIDVETARTRRYSLINPNFTIVGVDPGDGIGKNLAVARVNNDQFFDIIIGSATAAGPGNSRPAAGEVYIILGAATMTDRKLAETPANVTVIGARQGDQLGSSIAVGDVNNDQIGDLILGLPVAGTSTDQLNLAGRVIILFGGSSLLGQAVRDLLQDNQAPNVVIDGAHYADQFGLEVAAGDINGDRVLDIIAASPFADHLFDPQRTKVGVTYIIFGGIF
jgi:hypothetical protein